MKKLFTPFLLLLALSAYSQNYDCFVPSATQYFINANGYLRGMRIDTVRTFTDSTVFYPFHTPRGSYNPDDSAMPGTLDPDGGSWLGKRVVRYANGTYVFDSYWNDSFVIRTQAHPGEMWTLYSDSSDLYYMAHLVNVDTMTFMGVTDSVKIIMLHVMNASGPVPADPLNGFEILLSKNHGFVKVFDLYTFPYHKPDSTFRLGLDFFLDRALCSRSSINYKPATTIPDVNALTFHQVNFINPNDQQLYNWDTGDYIGSFSTLGIYMENAQWLHNAVVEKTVSAHSTTFIFNGSTPAYLFREPICSAGLFTFYDDKYSILKPGQVPEEKYPFGYYVFYIPDDTTFCTTSPMYYLINPIIHSLGWAAEERRYKLGLGKTYFNHADGDPYYESAKLTYSQFHGTACGPIPSDIPAAQQIALNISPNPASTELSITAPVTISTITVTDMLGRNIVQQPCSGSEAHIDVRSLPPAVYLVKVNGQYAGRFVKE